VSRPWTIAAAALAAGMAFIDTTALTVALPALRQALSASDSALLWIHNAYAIPLAALLLIGGSLGDRYGIRRVFLIGIALFGFASISCGVAPNTEILIALRAVQGGAAALMIPGSLSLIARVTPGHSLGRAIGLWSTFTLIATALGPVLGGLLVQHGHWRGVFLINAPLATAAFFMTLKRIDPDPCSGTRPGSLDVLGALLLAASLASLSYALIDRPLVLIVSIVGFGLFVLRQLSTPDALLPSGLFRSRSLVIAALVSLLVYAAWGGFTYLLPTFLIESLGFDPRTAGLLQLPSIIILAALSPLAGKLLDRHGPCLPLAVGSFLSTGGFAALLWPGFPSHPSAILVPLLILGAGLGFCVAPLSATIIGNVSAAHHGLASGINSTAARIASALGVALLGSLAYRSSPPDFRSLALAASLLCLLAFPLTLLLIRSERVPQV
jgi:EmrB/QacA subfamily drug resistance transporter